MTRLKTDKDLDEELSTWQDRTSADWVRNWNKENAINWVKILSRRATIKPKLTHSQAMIWYKADELSVRSNLAKMEWIKKFFNITEEDLK